MQLRQPSAESVHGVRCVEGLAEAGQLVEGGDPTAGQPLMGFFAGEQPGTHVFEARGARELSDIGAGDDEPAALAVDVAEGGLADGDAFESAVDYRLIHGSMSR